MQKGTRMSDEHAILMDNEDGDGLATFTDEEMLAFPKYVPETRALAAEALVRTLGQSLYAIVELLDTSTFADQFVYPEDRAALSEYRAFAAVGGDTQ